MLLGLLPAAAFGATWLALGQDPQPDWRRAFLRTSLAWGLALVALTEALSPFGLVRRPALLVAWAGLLVVALAAGFLRARRRGRVVWPPLRLPTSAPERALTLALGMVLALTALVAWRTPPQTWDSLNYHMARVAHWASMGAVRHYATGVEVQNSMPPMAEVAALHFYVLGRGDRLVNLVDWFALLGSVVAVSWIAGRLGLEARGQWLAALVAATVPMAIVQASSTMTDIVVGFWLLVAFVEVLGLCETGRLATGGALAGAAAGLALLTKPTAVPFLASLAPLGAYGAWRHGRVRGVLLAGLVAVGLLAAVNAGHWGRNLALYGSVVGDPGRAAQHGNQLRTVRGVVSNLLREVALELGTPSPHVNKALALGVRQVHAWLGLAVDDPRTTATGTFRVRPPGTDENNTTALAHTLLLLGSLGYVAWRWRDLPPLARYLAAALAAALLVYAALFKFMVFSNRLHLPFFLLGAPLIALVLVTRFPRRAWLCGLALFVLAVPWLVGVRSRPLLPLAEGSAPSVLLADRTDLYFANGVYLQEPYEDLAAAVADQGCTRVGLMLSGGGAEYPLWVLLGAPRPDLDIRWIVADTPSERLSDPTFQPCAIICERCPEDWSELRGLKRTLYRGGFALFQP